MIYNSILETIGNTPVVRLNHMGPDHVEMYVKVESFNPMASVKDRLAFAIINDAEQKGTLKSGQTVIEATSGNTGIALAMVCAAKGHPFVATMAESFSIERRKIMRGLGAKVILTPAAERGSGMVRRAEELAAEHGWFLARQFENPANPEYHRHTTGPEILRDFAGRRLDYWVTGYGTGGTMTGAGQVIKAARPEVKIVATEPAGAALLAGKEWAPHKIQGWTPDFIPRTGGQGGHIYGHFRRCDAGDGARCGRGCAPGLRDSRNAAGHGRALSEHAAFRRRRGGLGRRMAREPVRSRWAERVLIS